MSTSARGSLPKVLVAGGGSFLGASLCETLLLQNLKVICIDDFSSGRRENLLNCLLYPNFRLVEVNLNSYVVPKVDYIFHLAGLSEHLAGSDLSLRTLDVNAVGTRKLLQAAKEYGARFLLASSADLYREDFSPPAFPSPHFSYTEAKRFAEALVLEFSKKYKINARIVRLGDLYGPRMNLETGSVLGELIFQAVANKPLLIRGEGLNILHPTFVSDVVYGLMKAMFNEGTKGKIYTLVNPQEVTVLQLAYTLQELKPHLRLAFSPPKEEMRLPLIKMYFLPSQEELGWVAKVGLKEGLKQTLLWFENREDWEKKMRKEILERKKALEKERKRLEEEIKELKKKKMKKKKLKREEEEGQEEKEERKEEQISVAVLSSEPESLVVRELPLKGKLKRLRERLAGIKFEKKFSLPRPAFSPLFPRFSRRRIGLFLGLTVITFFLLYPFFSFALFGFLGLQRLEEFSSALAKQDFQKTLLLALQAETDFHRARKGLQLLSWLFPFFRKKEMFFQYDLLLEGAEELTSALVHLSQTLSPSLKAVKIITGAEAGDLEESLREAKLEVDRALDKLALAEGSFKNIKKEDFPQTLRSPISTAQQKIPQAGAKLHRLHEILSLLPEIVGLYQNRIYLLLFQNNMELRPGGGFIGSYGLLHFTGGRLAKMEIEDVYTADGQLKETALPPRPIKHYLQQDRWYLRDSNWSPHFPVNAAQAEWFLEKSLGVKVDGVFALDLSFLQKLLEAIGPIDLVDYQETIDAKNLFEIAEYHSEAKFFPGSKGKRDFLGSLARSLLERILLSEKEEWTKILSAFSSALKEKHLLVYFHDQKVNSLFTDQNFGGEVVLEEEEVVNQLDDYLLIVDANVGANKANFFLRREIYLLTVIDRDGGVAKRLTLVYHNQSPAETWPGGTYKNYLRIYVPRGSVLTKVKVGDLTDPGLVEKGRELGKTVFALYFEVPIQSRKRIIFDYQLPKGMQFSNNLGIYRLLVQKQPGVIDDRLKLTFNYPSFYQILRSEPVGKGGVQSIVYSTTLSQDRVFLLEFGR